MKQVVWLREEFRLMDNQAILEAFKHKAEDEKILLFFNLNPAQFLEGTYNHDYFFQALLKFIEYLKTEGIRMHLIVGTPLEAWQQLIATYPTIETVFLNEATAGNGVKRDLEVTAMLEKFGIKVKACQDRHLCGPHAVLKKDGTPYRVFTPYYRQWQAQVKRPYTQNHSVKGEKHWEDNQTLSEKGDRLLKRIVDEKKYDMSHLVGYERAADLLERFVHKVMPQYQETRDIPALFGTSGLSPYIKTGEISIRQIWQVANDAPDSLGKETFLKELAWRDFYHMIDTWFPKQRQEELKEEYQTLAWRHDEKAFKQWQEGMTGYPIIDAGMRQLATTGWMHNRLRMLTASFLTKDLLIDWRWGARHFESYLLDYDPASNTGGWQWAASTGTDAVPYFRIFNPTTQSERYDAKGTYIRRYVPELRHVPDAYIHEPAKMSRAEQQRYQCIIGEDYPGPMVNHKEARERALDFFKQS